MKDKIIALKKLGDLFHSFGNNLAPEGKLEEEFHALSDLVEKLHHYNPWFTNASVKYALTAWARQLETDRLESWLTNYTLQAENQKTVGVIMAGNIPLVGFHDAICVLLSGHKLHAKLSTKDQQLMAFVLEFLQKDDAYSGQIKLVENMKDIDALIATGSDNSARYFDYYFKDQEKIIRKNRTSIAVVKQDSTDEQLVSLGDDVFTHFGLGCRNVTKLYLPNEFDLDRVFSAFYHFKEIIQHNKYANNYDYNKAVYLLNNIDLLENGFLLMKEDEGIHSPIGVLFYSYYNDLDALESEINAIQDGVQCIVGDVSFANTDFGMSQQPNIHDYADGVDTLKFLSEL